MNIKRECESYRATLEENDETVQDLELSASRRLEEANILNINGKYHIAIYLAGLAAEMYLKTACFYVDGAKPGDKVQPRLDPMKRKKHELPFEAGHGLGFWSEELQERRRNFNLATPGELSTVITVLCNDWFIGMRYRPGFATVSDAARFITKVGWLADNHFLLRTRPLTEEVNNAS